MEEIHKLRAQIINIIRLYFPEADVPFSAKLVPPSKNQVSPVQRLNVELIIMIATQIKILKQLVTAASIDQVAARKDLVESNHSSGAQHSNSRGVPYRAMGISEDVFLHPSSVLSNRPPPDYIVFQEVVRTTRVFIKGMFQPRHQFPSDRVHALLHHQGLTIVNASWLSSLGKTTLCTYSKTFKRSDGILMVTPRFGPEGWELPAVKAENNPV